MHTLTCFPSPRGFGGVRTSRVSVCTGGPQEAGLEQQKEDARSLLLKAKAAESAMKEGERKSDATRWVSGTSCSSSPECVHLLNGLSPDTFAVFHLQFHVVTGFWFRLPSLFSLDIPVAIPYFRFTFRGPVLSPSFHSPFRFKFNLSVVMRCLPMFPIMRFPYFFPGAGASCPHQGRRWRR